MGAGDIRVVSGGYGTRTFDVDDRDTSGNRALLYGEPVKRGGAGFNFAVSVQTGDPENGTDVFLGITNRNSTETGSVDGTVEALLVGPGTILEGDASTAGSIDTAAELLGLMLDYVGFDVSATSVYTIDEDENGGSHALGLIVVGGDIIRTRVFVAVQTNCTLFGNMRAGGGTV